MNRMYLRGSAAPAALAIISIALGWSAWAQLAGHQPVGQPPPEPTRPRVGQSPGQPPGQPPDQPIEPPPATDIERARAKAELIKQGQLGLRDATAVAEKHVKGTALETTCEIQPGTASGLQPERPAPQPPRGPAAQVSTGEDRLIYRVSCFAGDRVQTVRVDGLTKKIIDVRNALSGR